MNRTTSLAMMLLLAAGFSLQLEDPANAGGFRAGRPERAVTLTNNRPSTFSGPSSYRPTRAAPSYGAGGYGSGNVSAQGRSAPYGTLGAGHGRRLTPAQSRALMNNPAFRRCGVDVSCTTRIVQGGDVDAVPPGLSVGDEFARDELRVMLLGAPPVARAAPVEPTPPPRRLTGQERLNRQLIRVITDTPFGIQMMGIVP